MIRMQSSGLLLSCLLVASPALAQDIRHSPPEVPPLAPEASTAKSAVPTLPAPVAESGERAVLPVLRGIVFVPDVSEASLARSVEGLDLAAVPWADAEAVQAYLRDALGKPASLESLRRLPEGISRLLREQGLPFVSVWVPPQDLTAGAVRIAVRASVADGPVAVVGAEHFSSDSYLSWVRQQAGAPIDVAALQEDIDWINRNPFRNVTLAAEPGARPDTTHLSLRVREQDPLRFFAGTDNTGTRSTGEERIFAGVNWGNAFGRGDQASYQYRADPSGTRSVTHSGSYQTDLPWRHTLALSAAWSQIRPNLGPFFKQAGTSWQAAAHYIAPLGLVAGGWRAEATAGVEIKYADNNLEFSSIPVTQNVTRVVQGVIGYGARREAGDSRTSLGAQLVLSPGRLLEHNDDVSFGGSRSGARARYGYLRLDGQHFQALPAGLAWDLRASAQISGAPLLGSEQMAGTGVGAVRGYVESGGFGDSGLLLRNELHLPALNVWEGWAADTFVFYDDAVLRTAGSGGQTTRYRSVGLGVSARLGKYLSLSLACGRPLEASPARRGDQQTHFQLQAAF